MVLVKRRSSAVKPRRPVGRPSKYRPEYCEELIVHMSRGLSKESFAGVVGVDADTIRRWEHDHTEFYAAAARGKERSRLWWEANGARGLFDTTESTVDADGTRRTVSRRLNSRVWDLNMKNRFGWRDQVDHSVEISMRTPAEEAADISATISA